MAEGQSTDAGSAHLTTLVARLLAAPPDAAFLDLLCGIAGGPSDLERALQALAEAARDTDPEAVGREYHDLFIGVGRGELVPYASHYLAGALNERPLAALRADLARLRIARVAQRSEPEDHAASVLEVMAGLADGSLAEVDESVRRKFFERHVAPWMDRFLGDLETAEAAAFYRPVARLGRMAIALEADALRVHSQDDASG